MAKNAKGKLVVVTGPSGVGKSTIVKEAARRTGSAYSVSATTRTARAGESQGRDYHFVDLPTFEGMVQRGQLLEWAEVYGQCYGTPAGPVTEAIEAGKTVLLDIDLQGAKQVHRNFPQGVFVLIGPPGPKILAERLKKRGTENPQELSERLAKAAQETAAAQASGLYNHHVVNDDLEQAVRRVVDIIS